MGSFSDVVESQIPCLPAGRQTPRPNYPHISIPNDQGNLVWNFEFGTLEFVWDLALACLPVGRGSGGSYPISSLSTAFLTVLITSLKPGILGSRSIKGHQKPRQRKVKSRRSAIPKA